MKEEWDHLIVVLDANVLFQALLRDTLLRMAEIDLLRLRWSEEILAEVSRNLVGTGRVTEGQAQRLISLMTEAFPEAMVTGYEKLIGELTNDPKDRHVLAAAVEAKAQIIVTFNVRDFPERALVPFDVVAQTPDQFLVMLFKIEPQKVLESIKVQAEAYQRSPKSVAEILQALEKSVPIFAKLVGMTSEQS